jgi:hypothetical protein
MGAFLNAKNSGEYMETDSGSVSLGWNSSPAAPQKPLLKTHVFSETVLP